MGVAETAPGRREKRRQATRTRIEEAAYTLFGRQGVEATSIEQICDEAGVARRTFYGYFANKHALLGGLGISRLYSQAEPMLAHLLSSFPDTRSRLTAMIDYIEERFATFDEVDRQLILLAPSVLAGDTEQQRDIADQALNAFAALFAAGQDSGDIPATFSPEILAAMVVGTLNTLTTRWAIDSNYPVIDKLEEARQLFARAAGCPEAG